MQLVLAKLLACVDRFYFKYEAPFGVLFLYLSIMNTTKLRSNLSIVALFSALIFAICLVYGQFLHNPLIFDDQNLFLQINAAGKQVIDDIHFSVLGLRTLPYASFAWTKALWGTDLIYFRVGNLLLHLGVSFALYGFLQQLFSHLYSPKSTESITAQQAAAIAAFLFALHPMASYAVGYLVQRTILMATLFSLLALWSYSKGSIQNKAVWLWASVPLYYFAVFSKEHAIMLPVVLVALTVVLHANWRSILLKNTFVFLALAGIALVVIFIKRSIIGTVYEIDAPAMLGPKIDEFAYPLSIITQCGLFFKYLFLWVAPNTPWTSIDMRESFAPALWSWHLLGLFAFGAWGAASMHLLFKRGHMGLIGLAMVAPWLLFFTELASVRVQEPFVLYRSYLWVVACFVAFPVALATLNRKMVISIVTLVCFVFALLTMERLATFSHPILVWEDAARLIQNKKNIIGHDRIYYNLARNQYLNDILEPAEKNAKLAISIDSDFAQAHAILGAIYIKKAEYELAVKQYTISREINQRRSEPPSSVYLMGRARAYEGSGKFQEAANDYLEACRINFDVCEMLRKSATVVP